MVCGKCKTAIPDGSKYCLRCGHSVFWQENGIEDRIPVPSKQDNIDEFKMAMEEIEQEKREIRHKRIKALVYCAVVALVLLVFAWLKNVESCNGLLDIPRELETIVEIEGVVCQLSDCESYYSVVNLAKNHSTIISIPSECGGIPVKAIAEEAFKDSDVVSVYIPDSVNTIGARAFAGAEYLQKVRLPNDLKIIEESTFESCEALYKIDVSPNLMVIKAMAFAACDSLEGMTIPASIVWVDTNAFYSCGSLRFLQFEGYGLPWISDLNVQAWCSINAMNKSAAGTESDRLASAKATEFERLLINMPEIDKNLQYLLDDKLTNSLSHRIFSLTASLLKAKQMYLLNADLPAYVETVRYLREYFGEPFVFEAIEKALSEASNEYSNNLGLELDFIGSQMSLHHISLGGFTFLETEDAKKEAADAYVEGCFYYFLDGEWPN